MSKKEKKSSGKAGFISWIAVTSFLLVFLLVLTILEQGLLNSIFTTILGGKKPIFAKGDDAYEAIYTSDYDSKDAAVKAGNELNVKIEQEGAVLLLNELMSDGKTALPISKGSKVSVFGKSSVNLVLGGSGSGTGNSDGAATLFDGLKEGGIEYNPQLKKFYESNASGSGRSSSPKLKDASSSSPTLEIGETPVDKYTAAVKSSFKDYDDAAIVVISRLGGESWDLPRVQADDATRHYLQLDANEEAMLKMVTDRFEKVIVMLNTLTSFQCDFIEKFNNTENDKRIDAVLWIGGPGKTGAKGLGALLNGEVSPSGRTNDLYAKDFTKAPTWVNFGDNSQVNNNETNTAFLEGDDEESAIPGYNMVTYEEGVYLGYRYYETRAYEELKLDPSSTWYEENVMFPFGYGLSYTKFNQTITGVTGSLNNKGTITITVEVENIGEKAGKDVVELYVTKPYYEGGIEKSQVELVDFSKTDLLEAKTGKQTVTFKVNAYDLASYDYNDANRNGFPGYELEAGDYTFYISANSHVSEYAYDSTTVTVDPADVITGDDGEAVNVSWQWEKDPVTTNKVENRYTFSHYDEDGNLVLDDYDDIQYRLSDVEVLLPDDSVVIRKGMTRIDFEGSFPTPLKIAERKANTTVLNGFDEKGKLRSQDHNNTDIEGIVAENGMPTTGKSGIDLILHDMVDEKGYVDYKDTRWGDLLDKLTFDDMKKLVNNGAFKTEAIQSIGKNLTNDSDGPVGFVNFMGGSVTAIFSGNTSFACECVIGSTWNKDLAYQMGLIVGENGLWGDQSGNNGLPYSGWYAPGVNLHRTPFSGRNFEYYSEDPILTGKMAVNVITAASEKGVYADLKHFALNDQETNRAGVSTFCTEQALRELYLKPFELAVKGNDTPRTVKMTELGLDDRTVSEFKGTTGIMSSFNRIGNKWTGGDYRLMTQILRDEWGFKGLVICDYKTDNTFMNSKQMLYAGNDLILASLPNLMWDNPNPESAEDVTILRQATHHILYTVASSNSIQFNIIGYQMEWWISLTIALDVIIPVGLAVWGFFAVRKFVKNRKNKQTEPVDQPEQPEQA